MFQHLVRRGLEHAASAGVFERAVEHGSKAQIPAWGAILLVLTFVLSIVAIVLIDYTLKDVLATLIIVESPPSSAPVANAVLKVAEPASKDEKEGLLDDEVDSTLVHQKLVTSSIRSAIRHIVAQGGRLARFRGFGIQALWASVFSIVFNTSMAVIPFHFPGKMVLLAAFAGALCAPLHCAWTHKVISAPSSLSFSQRIPRSRQSFQTLLLPAAVFAAVPYLALCVVQALAVASGLTSIRIENARTFAGGEIASVTLRGIALFVLIVMITTMLYLPALATLIRVEASLLPEDQDTIVPVDRSFGGSGGFGLVDAWKSFGWEARRRLFKHYVKTYLIVYAMGIFLVFVLMVELFAIAGPSIGKQLSQGVR